MSGSYQNDGTRGIVKMVVNIERILILFQYPLRLSFGAIPENGYGYSSQTATLENEQRVPKPVFMPELTPKPTKPSAAF